MSSRPQYSQYLECFILMLCPSMNLDHQSVCMIYRWVWKEINILCSGAMILVYSSVKYSVWLKQGVLMCVTCCRPVYFGNIIHFGSTNLHVSQSFQTQWWSHSHQNSEHWWLLWPVWRWEVCNSLRAGPVLHGKPGAAKGEEWRSHRTPLSPQLCWSNHGKVSCCECYWEYRC